MAPAAVMLLAAMPAVSAAAPPAPSSIKVLGGFTSQGYPVVVQIARGAHAISVAGIGLDMKCSSKAEFGLPDRWVRVPVRASGKFRDFATIPASGASGTEITGGSDLFTGRLDRRRWTVTGTWDLKLAFQTSAGQSDTCDSGRVTFTVHQ